MEPRITNQGKQESKQAEKPAQAQEEPQPKPKSDLTSDQQAFWNWVQRNKALDVSEMAIFPIKEGLVLVPLDPINRPILDSSLYLRYNSAAMKRLIESLGAKEE